MTDFDGRVAIVTGAGGGLGRAHAEALARAGARVVVNDVGDGAVAVAASIGAAGGTAIADRTDITDETAVRAMVDGVLARWGRIDILVNNAGVLRDRSFGKSDLADFRTVLDVHLMGSVHCTHAVWPHMAEAGYGRIVMTTSVSGIYGNFGQANYGAAKSALVGLMNVLAIEGRAKGIRVNALAPTAATQMTEGLIEPEKAALVTPESISPGVLFLVSENAPTGVILGAGGGVFAVSRMVESTPVFVPEEQRTPEGIASRWAEIDVLTDLDRYGSAFEQTDRYLQAIPATTATENSDA
ncbi:SDR family NAD(P)-dependent oxidoreductase [Tsukamurella sp. NPDC003166]|uniref:SDR family NAD(P)-dependent oxidoreductase n=1 Tax=Tsukamurella sp. NPDC003166 TaxID=3154444 RepID=UPI0033A1243F